MKPVKILFISFVLLFQASLLRADNGMRVWFPAWGGSGFSPSQAALTDPLIEIEPMGLYAQVSMIFTINAQYSMYSSGDTLEAVLNFDLPPNSYIHDSWLWLDSITIIRAAVMERNAATQIYDNLVKKIRRDPSLLLKNGPNSYSLNVWPLKISYPRKVKIVYATPFEWMGNRFTVPLPVGLLKASKVLPDADIRIKHDGIYSAPAFIEAKYNDMVQSSTFSQDNLKLTAGDYENLSGLNLTYNIGGNGIFFSTFPTGPDEGIYQLGINPALIPGKVHTPKYITVLLDHTTSNNTIRDFSEVKTLIASRLLRDYTVKDSFSIFYINNGVKQTSAGWLPADSANVYSAINSIASDATFQSSYFEQLLKNGLSFCRSKQAANAHAIIISDNPHFNDTSYFVTLRDYLGGTFPNKVFTINNSETRNGFTGPFGSEALLKKISQSSGGQYHTNTVKYELGNYSYQLDIDNILRSIMWLTTSSTSSYSIDIPVSGFVYSAYEINGSGKFSPDRPYFETGKYYGTFNPSSDIEVEYLTSSGYTSMKQSPGFVHWGENHYIKTWVNNYIKDLIGQNNSFLKQEIIDSSINNRVLCDLTAFIALETGDTVKGKDDDTIPTTLQEAEESAETVKIYPNPFTDNVTIEFATGTEEIIICDVMGRIVYQKKIGHGEEKLVWNGKDNSGNALPAGVYMVMVKAADAKTVIKVVKQ